MSMRVVPAYNGSRGDPIVFFPRFAHNLRISKTGTTRSVAPRRQAARGAPAQPTDLRLGRIVRLLMEHATSSISGTKMAEEISSNRSEVWRLIQQLRGLGVDVADTPRPDINCARFPICSCPMFSRPLLRGTIFDTQIHHYYKIGSTNTAAMAAAAEGAPEGSVFLAEEQTAGRGRGANSWQSPRSTGIYCSVVLAARSAAVGSVGAFARSRTRGARGHCSKSIRAYRPDLKWPNDVLIDGKKVCGILTEMNAEATRVRYIVVGIGINVNQASFPEELRRDLAAPRDRKRVVARRVGGCFVKITRPRVSAVCAKTADARESILRALCRAFLVGAEAKRFASRKTVQRLKERPKAWMSADFCGCGPPRERKRF